MIITLFTITRYIPCLNFWLSICLPKYTWCSCVDPIHRCLLPDGWPRDAYMNYVVQTCALYWRKRKPFSHARWEAKRHAKQQIHSMNGRTVGLPPCVL